MVITNLDSLIDRLVSNNISVAAANENIAVASAYASSSASSALIATDKATEAGNSALSALVSEQNAAGSELAASQSGAAALASALTAEEQAEIAIVAKNKAYMYSNYAHDSLAATNLKYDEFDDRYLGIKASDPATDNDGLPIQEGALYWNTTIKGMMVYSGTVWAEVAAASGALLISNNLADILDKAAARTNLGVESSAELNSRDIENRKRSNHTGTQLANTISDFDTAVSASPDVAANTLVRHTHTNKAHLDTINQDLAQNSLVQFSEVSTNTLKVGFSTVTWDEDERTLSAVLNSTGTTLQLGQEILINVRNGSGATIVDGMVLMAVGTLGASGRIVVTPYDGTKSNSHRVIGVATTTALNGADGFAATFGKVRGLNTTGAPVGETWVEGDILYAKPNTSGGVLTNIVPQGDEVRMPIAVVINPHTNGTMLVRSDAVDHNEHAMADSIGVAAQGNLSATTIQLAIESLLVDIEW